MMPAGTVLRPGHAREARALNLIERRAASLLRGHQAHALFSRHLLPLPELEAAADAGRLLVAECEGAAVGYTLHDTLHCEAHLVQMDVDPVHGRRGIGRALLEAACRSAADSGLPAIVLTTLVDVPWNAPFYAGAGFQALPPSRWTPSLRALMAQEQRLGFPMHLRVAMRRPLS